MSSWLLIHDAVTNIRNNAIHYPTRACTNPGTSPHFHNKVGLVGHDSITHNADFEKICLTISRIGLVVITTSRIRAIFQADPEETGQRRVQHAR